MSEALGIEHHTLPKMTSTQLIGHRSKTFQAFIPSIVIAN